MYCNRVSIHLSIVSLTNNAASSAREQVDHHPQQTTRWLNHCGQKVNMKSKSLLPC